MSVAIFFIILVFICLIGVGTYLVLSNTPAPTTAPTPASTTAPTPAPTTAPTPAPTPAPTISCKDIGIGMFKRPYLPPICECDNEPGLDYDTHTCKDARTPCEQLGGRYSYTPVFSRCYLPIHFEITE